MLQILKLFLCIKENLKSVYYMERSNSLISFVRIVFRITKDYYYHSIKHSFNPFSPFIIFLHYKRSLFTTSHLSYIQNPFFHNDISCYFYGVIAANVLESNRHLVKCYFRCFIFIVLIFIYSNVNSYNIITSSNIEACDSILCYFSIEHEVIEK